MQMNREYLPIGIIDYLLRENIYTSFIIIVIVFFYKPNLFIIPTGGFSLLISVSLIHSKNEFGFLSRENKLVIYASIFVYSGFLLSFEPMFANTITRDMSGLIMLFSTFLYANFHHASKHSPKKVFSRKLLEGSDFPEMIDLEDSPLYRKIIYWYTLEYFIEAPREDFGMDNKFVITSDENKRIAHVERFTEIESIRSWFFEFGDTRNINKNSDCTYCNIDEDNVYGDMCDNCFADVNKELVEKGVLEKGESTANLL